MPNTPFATSRFRTIFAAAWLLWIGLHALVLYWYGYGFQVALADSLISNLLLAAACLMINNVFRHYLPSANRYSYLLAFCLALTILWFLLSRFLLILILRSFTEYEAFFSNSVPVRFGVAFLILGGMLLLSLLWYNLQNQQEQERRNSETGRLAKEAELLALRQQLQPHFLFNSLNSINALIGQSPGQARQMVQELSDFLRGTLYKNDQQKLTLEEEFRHLELYLNIEKVRFGHRLLTEIEYDPELAQKQVPAMILQPIVENAIKFGLYDTLEPVTITIKAFMHENLLCITVQNPFDPQTALPVKGAGFGLSSIKRRLFLLFAWQGLVKTHAEGNIFTTTIHLPQPV